MSDEIPDLQKGFIHAHKRMLSALRNILALIGAATLAIGAAAVTMPVLSGAIWERLSGAWASWSDPVNTIVSGVIAAIVAVTAAIITTRPAQRQAEIAIFDILRQRGIKTKLCLEALESAHAAMKRIDRSFDEMRLIITSQETANLNAAIKELEAAASKLSVNRMDAGKSVDTYNKIEESIRWIEHIMDYASTELQINERKERITKITAINIKEDLSVPTAEIEASIIVVRNDLKEINRDISDMRSNIYN